ncbi:MAG TPA: helix-turn-helix transcriptional regulator [Actinomycetota bacterium]
MRSSALLRAARRRAGITQRQLARRAEMPQASLSRIERGVVSPAADTLDRLLRECGLELDAVPRPGGGVDHTLIHERLRMSPGQRARRAVVEWEGTKVFRELGRRASTKSSTPSSPSGS